MQPKRSDGLDNALSPNGPHPQYYLRHTDGTRDGEYGCPREAELSPEYRDGDTIEDQAGRVIDRPE